MREISRQLRWRRKKMKDGLCAQCGTRKIQHYSQMCDECAHTARSLARIRTGMNPWRRGKRGRPPIVP